MSIGAIEACAAKGAADVVEAAAGGTYAWVGKVAREWGIFAAMTAFFIWQSAVREGALNKQIADQQSFMRETLVQLVQKNTAAFESFKATLEQQKK